MQIDMASQEELASQVNTINHMNNIEVLYIADSLVLSPERVANLFTFKKASDIPWAFTPTITKTGVLNTNPPFPQARCLSMPP